MRTKIYIKDLKEYFRNELGMEPRHCLKASKKAFNLLNKELNTDVKNLVYLIFENRPIGDLNTHSYGFHTRNGRYIVETFKSFYYNFV